MPGEREIVIQVERCGICGSDLHMTDGAGLIEVPAGSVLGHEYSGVVVAVGKNVDSVTVGDAVSALAMPACGRCPSCLAGELMWCEGADKLIPSGAYAEYISVGAASAVPLAEGLGFDLGALVEPMAVAHHAVELASAKPGDRTIVLGAGPIALATVYWLRERGIDDVTVVARTSRRKDVASAMGATDFVASGEHVDDSGGIGIDPGHIVFEAAGNQGALASALGLVRSRGTIVGLGFHDEPDPVIPALFVMQEVRLQFAMMYSKRDYTAAMDSMRKRPEAAAQLVTSTVSLDELPSAFEALRGQSNQCKVLVAPQL
jgi:(R,R)-butanediol dehydrogenase/meso-butanediol dehydrogenase/diacetyl reductase